MFNFSFGELLVLGVIGLVVLGPKQLPRMANILGRVYREFKKAIQDVTQDVTQAARNEMKGVEEFKIAPKTVLDQKVKSIEEVMKELGK